LAVSSIVFSFAQITETAKQAAGRRVLQEFVDRKAVLVFPEECVQSVGRVHSSIIPEIANMSTENYVLRVSPSEKP
jgi:hypothetical protein